MRRRRKLPIPIPLWLLVTLVLVLLVALSRDAFRIARSPTGSDPIQFMIQLALVCLIVLEIVRDRRRRKKLGARLPRISEKTLRVGYWAQALYLAVLTGTPATLLLLLYARELPGEGITPAGAVVRGVLAGAAFGVFIAHAIKPVEVRVRVLQRDTFLTELKSSLRDEGYRPIRETQEEFTFRKIHLLPRRVDITLRGGEARIVGPLTDVRSIMWPMVESGLAAS